MSQKVSLVQKQERNPANLLVASSHLFFYMDFLSEKVELISRYKGKRIQGGVITALTDSFLINSRKLIEFLYAPITVTKTISSQRISFQKRRSGQK